MPKQYQRLIEKGQSEQSNWPENYISSNSDMINILNIEDNSWDKKLPGKTASAKLCHEYHFPITRRVCIAKLFDYSPERKNFSRHLIEGSLKMYQNPGEDGEGVRCPGLNGA